MTEDASQVAELARTYKINQCSEIERALDTVLLRIILEGHLPSQD